MSGISDKAINKLTNQNKFNGGVELEEDYGVNLYSTFYRQYDPQLGRFSGVDILSERTMGLSAYQFGINNPVTYNDPSGALALAGQVFVGIRDHINSGGSIQDIEVDGGSVDFLSAGSGGGGGGGEGGYESFSFGSFSSTSVAGMYREFGAATGMNLAITPGMAERYFQQQWAGTGRNDISAKYAGGVQTGNGFEVNWNSDGNGSVLMA